MPNLKLRSLKLKSRRKMLCGFLQANLSEKARPRNRKFRTRENLRRRKQGRLKNFVDRNENSVESKKRENQRKLTLLK
jgi:hypothetical protein